MALFTKASQLAQARFAELRSSLSPRIENLRDQLAHIEALPQLTLLGLITGILAGLIIVLFRWVIDIPLALSLPDHGENFEALPMSYRFLLPVIGGLLLGLRRPWSNMSYHVTGIGHVLDRLPIPPSRMALSIFIHQVGGGAPSLPTGHSVCREGPAIHLGVG